MSTEFERDLTTWLADETPPREPEGFADTVLEATVRTRRLPAWSGLEWWLPMQTTARFGPALRPALMLTVLALLTALTVAIIVAANQRQLPPPFGLAGNGLIAFEYDGDIWVANQDGTGRRPLVQNDDAWEGWPVWSRDGTHLAFWSAPEDLNQYDSRSWTTATFADLIVVDENGGDARVVASDGQFPSAISWSRSGDLLAYSSGLPGVTDARVHVARSDGTGATSLGEPDLDAWGPAFSPDGWSIAFHAGNHDAERGIFLMDRNGDDLRQVSHTTGGEHSDTMAQVGWSPDGLFIIETVGSGSSYETRVFRLDGLHEVSITDHPQLGEYPYGSFGAVYSPDGALVAYTRVTDKTEVVITRADGTDVYVVEGITVDPFTSLEWAPDGSRLIAIDSLKTNDQEPGLIIIDPTGEQPPVGLLADGSWSWQRVAADD